MSDEPDPYALIEAVALRKDRAAFAVLFGVYAPKVRGYLLRSSRDEVQADEWTQEVMLRVWRRAGSYDPAKAAPSTWIFTIARNVRIDAARKVRPELDPADPALVPSQPLAPDSAVDRQRRQHRVRAAVGALPDAQAGVLRGAYFDGKTLRQIAEEQELPLGTVKSRVRLAMARLRQHLEGT
ncbi:MAG: sigma-70 family RNA polymerase sigma factor [Proteobacteria bacterium]|nr:sigma-70 family RNA polymerase sigma factor [Pseudomonadota bacterium]